jgi:hypothetical protein
VSVDKESERSLADFAKQVAGIPKRIAEAGNDIKAVKPIDENNELPAAAELAGTKEDPGTPPAWVNDDLNAATIKPPTTEADADSRGNATRIKQQRTPDEIAKVIIDTLRTIDHCPDRGFIVTVYGSNPWNAMLTIRPEAGTTIDRALWTSRVRDIGIRLRADFDVT